MFDREKLDDFLLELNCVGFYDPPMRLRGGRESIWYVDLRTHLQSVETKQQLARFVYDFVQEQQLKPDYFLGVSEGATLLGATLNDMIDYKLPNEIPATILRARPRDRGLVQDKYSVGPLDAGYKVVLVEDVSTTGSGISEMILRLQERGVTVLLAVTVVNRLERRDEPDGRSVKEFIEENYGVPYRWMTDAETILPKAFERSRLDREFTGKVNAYYEKYGVVKITV